MNENEGYKAGLAVRKKVLGAKYVEDSIANADEFMQPLQQYLTEHAWGASWTRDGLSLKTRSMLNLAMLTALNRPHELRIHLRGAFLQCGVYCGAPAALESFKIAKEVLAEKIDPA